MVAFVKRRVPFFCRSKDFYSIESNNFGLIFSSLAVSSLKYGMLRLGSNLFAIFMAIFQ